MCDNGCGREAEYRRPDDYPNEAYCLECLLDHGEEQDDLIYVGDVL